MPRFVCKMPTLQLPYGLLVITLCLRRARFIMAMAVLPAEHGDIYHLYALSALI